MAATTEPETPKAQPYTFDLGHLACIDTNPLPAPSSTGEDRETILRATAQGCAQALITQLLTACAIIRSADGDLQVQLPAPETQLPREKHVPKDKEKTKWEKFAEKKGIKSKKRDGKLVYDEAKGDWVPKYGYKGKSEGISDDWLVEVDTKADKKRAPASEQHGKPKKMARRGK